MSSTPAADRPGARGPYAKGVKRRREILDRALAVFAQKGMDGASLRAIGDAIGVAHSSLKNYFPTKEALLLAVVLDNDETSTALAAQQNTVIDRFTVSANQHVEVPGYLALYTSLLAAAVGEENVDSKEFFTDRFSRGREDVAERLTGELAQRGTTLPDEELRMIASVMMAASDGLQAQWLLDRSIDIAGCLRLLERLFTNSATTSSDSAS